MSSISLSLVAVAAAASLVAVAQVDTGPLSSEKTLVAEHPPNHC
jgi:hypothetical protein